MAALLISFPFGAITSIVAPIYAAARRSAKIRENGFTGIERKILPRLNGINPIRNGRLLSGMATSNAPGAKHAGSGTTTLEP